MKGREKGGCNVKGRREKGEGLEEGKKMENG